MHCQRYWKHEEQMLANRQLWHSVKFIGKVTDMTTNKDHQVMISLSNSILIWSLKQPCSSIFELQWSHYCHFQISQCHPFDHFWLWCMTVETQQADIQQQEDLSFKAFVEHASVIWHLAVTQQGKSSCFTYHFLVAWPLLFCRCSTSFRI